MRLGRAAGGDDAVSPGFCSRRATWQAAALSSSATLMNARPRSGSAKPARGQRLAERERHAHGDAHHLAGRAHLRPEDRVDARELGERKHALLDRDVFRQGAVARCRARRAFFRPSPWRRSWRAAGRSPWPRTARCARRAGSLRARRPVWSLTANCTFIRPITPSSSASARAVLLDLGDHARHRASAAAARWSSRRSARRPPRCAASRRRSPRAGRRTTQSTSTSIAFFRNWSIRSVCEPPSSRAASIATPT